MKDIYLVISPSKNRLLGAYQSLLVARQQRTRNRNGYHKDAVILRVDKWTEVT